MMMLHIHLIFCFHKKAQTELKNDLPLGPSSRAAAHRPLSSLLSPQSGFRLSLSVSQGAPTPSASSTLKRTNGNRRRNITSLLCPPYSQARHVIPLYVLTFQQSPGHQSARGDRKKVSSFQTIIKMLLFQHKHLFTNLSPPAVHRERASACAQGRNVFGTDSSELGSSGLSGSGDTAPLAPPPFAPPPRGAALLPPMLHVLHWSEPTPAPSSCSPLSIPKRGTRKWSM